MVSKYCTQLRDNGIIISNRSIFKRANLKNIQFLLIFYSKVPQHVSATSFVSMDISIHAKGEIVYQAARGIPARALLTFWAIRAIRLIILISTSLSIAYSIGLMPSSSSITTVSGATLHIYLKIISRSFI